MDSEELFNCSLDIAFGKIRRYWDKNGFLFPDYYQKYFKSNIYEMIEQKDINKIDSITKSIFSFLNILNFYCDKESQFLTCFEQYYGLNELYNKKILVVTQSYLPALVKKIADTLDNKEYSGYIKSIGPNIILGLDDQMNFEIIRRAFRSKDAINEDLLISFYPRENAEKVLYSAINEQKELLLNIDGYIPEGGGLFNPTKEDYLNKLYNYTISHKDPLFDVDIINYSKDDDKALVLRKK